MKYTSIVLLALFGYVQAVKLSVADDELPTVERRERPARIGKGDSDSDDEPLWPAGIDNKGSKGGLGKGLIFSAEAGANSEQGQSVKVLPDT